MRSQATIKWQWPFIGLASSSTAAVIFFTWALSSPPYEELHSIIGGENYYTSDTLAQLPDIDSISDQLPPKHRATLYLHKVKTSLDGPERLKNIRLAIEASPESEKSYDILYNFVEHIPINFGIPGYLSKLYAFPSTRQEALIDITNHRFEMFNEPKRQQQFLDGLSNELREAHAKLKPKSLQELKTQIHRNE